MIRLDEDSDVGTSLTLRGQNYSLVRLEQRDGKPPLAVLETQCAECGRSFETKTPMVIKWLSRRCPEHKAPGLPVRTR